MDHHRPVDVNPPSRIEAQDPQDHESNKDGSRKVFPYSIKIKEVNAKEQANAKAAGR